MRARSAAAAIAVLATPAGASAATIAVSPLKPCYRAGETVALAGSGYTPNASVQINSDGRVVGSTAADAAGNFGGGLTLGLASGERVKTYSAVDTTPNISNTASIPLRVSRLNVSVKPRNGQAGRLLSIGARGFTTGKTLYAHVVRGRYRRNLRIGRLKAACHKLSVQRRVFSNHSKAGTYTVQFDTRRHYSKKTAVRYRFSVPVFRSASARAAANQTWMPG